MQNSNIKKLLDFLNKDASPSEAKEIENEIAKDSSLSYVLNGLEKLQDELGSSESIPRFLEDQKADLKKKLF